MFYKFYKRLQNKRVCVLIYYIGKGYFLTGQREQAQCKSGLRHTTSFEVVNLVLGLKMCM